MKRVIVLGLCLLFCSGVYAQSLGSRMANIDTELELGESQFALAPLSYIYFGFNALTNTNDAVLKQNMGFFRSQQLGVNIAEIAYRPFGGARLSLGADFSANWFNLQSDYMWCPAVLPIKDGRASWGPNGRFVDFGPKEEFGIKEVDRSVLSVCSFGVPLTFSYTVRSFTVALGGTLEVNLDGCIRFKGVDEQGNNINEMRSGNHYSNKIGVNRLGFNVHAAFSYGGLGLYFKYNPVPKFYKGIVNEQVIECGPQFQTWSVGLIMGLGM